MDQVSVERLSESGDYMDFGIFPYEIEAWGVNSNTYFQILNILKVTGVDITKKTKKKTILINEKYILLFYYIILQYLIY